MNVYCIETYGEIKDIKPMDLEHPPVGVGELLVRVKAAAINPADLKVISGKEGGKFLHDGKAPIRIGYDFSGVIEQAGINASGFAEGDSVFGFLPYSSKTTQGSFSQYVVVKSDAVAKKPEEISFAEAASCATTAGTALQAFFKGNEIKEGQAVLVNGASGGVGSFAVQIAKSFGAEVWGTASAASLDFIRSIGCKEAFDYKRKELKDLNKKFNFIIDAVSNSSFGYCSEIMAPGACYVTMLPSLGFFTGKIRSLFSSKSCAIVLVKPKKEHLTQIAGMLESKAVTAHLAATFPIEELHKALETLKAGGVKGKIALKLED